MANPLKKVTDALTGTLDVKTAEERAQTARKATIEAGQAVTAARAALSVADEAGEPGYVEKAEAALIAAERAADRATRSLEVAERGLERARATVDATARSDATKRLREALAQRVSAARAIDQGADSIAAALKQMQDADAAVGEAQRAGVASPNAVAAHNFGGSRAETLISLALAIRGLPSEIRPFDASAVPSTVQAVERDNATIAGQ